jgi:hypothetical protein
LLCESRLSATSPIGLFQQPLGGTQGLLFTSLHERFVHPLGVPEFPGGRVFQQQEGNFHAHSVQPDGASQFAEQ